MYRPRSRTAPFRTIIVILALVAPIVGNRSVASPTPARIDPASAASVNFLADGAHFAAGWSLRLAALGRGDTFAPIASVTPTDNGIQVSYVHDDVTEWYRQQGAGIEQGVTLSAPPDGAGSLALIIATSGAAPFVDAVTNTATVFAPDGGRWSYSGLRVVDATGRALPARLTQADGGIGITVVDEGAIYPVTVDPYIAGQTLNDPADTSNDNFGFATVMSSDGNTLVASGRLFSTGAGVVYIYARSNGSFPLSPTQTLNDPGANPGQNGFGGAVALSADGAMMLIGASGTATGGAAYLYLKVNGSFPLTPTQTFTDPGNTLNDQFGKAVSVRGDGRNVVIGAPGTNTRQGAIYIYFTTTAPQSGSQKEAAISPRVPAAPFSNPPTTVDDPYLGDELFGDGISLPPDPNPVDTSITTLIVRASGTSNHPGRIFMITYPTNGGGTPTIMDVGAFKVVAKVAADPGVYFLGSGLAQSNNSDTLLIGSPVSSGFKGVAFVFARVNGSYTLAQTLTNPGTSGDQFGYAAAMSADGNTLLIGTRGTSSQPGVAYLYTKVNGSFPTTPTQTFSDPAHTNFDFFGIAVAMSGDGSVLAIGASNTNGGKGAVYPFTLQPPPNTKPPRHADGTPVIGTVPPLPGPHPTPSPQSGGVAPQPPRH